MPDTTRRIVVFPIPTTDLWAIVEVETSGDCHLTHLGSRFTTKSIARIAAQDLDCPVVTYPEED